MISRFFCGASGTQGTDKPEKEESAPQASPPEARKRAGSGSSSDGDDVRPTSSIAMPGGRLPFPGFEPIGRVDELPALSAFKLRSGEDVCVVKTAGAPAASSAVGGGGVSSAPMLRALSNVCPHKQACMHLGDIEDSTNAILCPRHRKKFPGGLHFDITTGKSFLVKPPEAKYDPSWKLSVYEVKVDSSTGFAYVSSVPVKVESGAGGREEKEREKERRRSSAGGEGGGGSVTHTTAAAAGVVIAVTAAGGDEGHVVPSSSSSSSSSSATSSPSSASLLSPPPTFAAVHFHQRHSTDGVKWAPCTIASITRDTHDTNLYRLVPAGSTSSSSPPPSPGGGGGAAGCDRHSWHLSLRLSMGDDSDDAVSREYTPVSTLEEWLGDGKGGPRFLDLLIKLYPKGRLTSRLASFKAGDTVYVSPPETTLAPLLPPDDAVVLERPPEKQRKTLSLSYSVEDEREHATNGGGAAGAASAVLSSSSTSAGSSGSSSSSALISPADAESALAHPSTAMASAHLPVRVSGGPGSAVLFIAGGTGVTPLVQLARWCIRPTSSSFAAPEKVYLVCSNHTAKDILMRETLAKLVASDRARLRLLHTLTGGGTKHGRVGEAASGALLPASADGDGDAVPPALPDELGGSVYFSRGRISTALLSAFLAVDDATRVGGTGGGGGGGGGGGPVPPNGLQRVVVSGPKGMFEAAKSALVGAGFSSECVVELES